MPHVIRRFTEFLLSAGSYEGESRDRQARRRIVVGILWISVVGLLGAALSRGAPWVGVVNGLKASAHLGTLLALRVWPRRLTVIFFAMSVFDVLADVVISLLYGGLHESGLQVLWSLVPVLGLLIISTVRVAAAFMGVFLAAVVAVTALSPNVGATYRLDSPESDTAFGVIAVTLFVFGSLFYFVRQRDRFQQESDDLLHNILPDSVATRLKESQAMIADSHESVSVLFADVVDFTPLSAGMSAEDLVSLLNSIFSRFDQLVDERGLEKIKTVGDEYMVAAGLPESRRDHASAIADLALAMRDQLASDRFDGHRIRMRIGINSGPVVAGIIGTHKFAYDLWGDVVNTASRMESEGIEGSIQITESTYRLIDDTFVCEPRGTVSVKGKAPMETYILVSRRP
jgi:adenylate cyclase